MTPEDAQKAINDGTFISKLLQEVHIEVSGQGIMEMKMKFPKWFSEVIAPESQAFIIEQICKNSQRAFDESSFPRTE
mgnify:CR=1 FL=1